MFKTSLSIFASSISKRSHDMQPSHCEILRFAILSSRAERGISQFGANHASVRPVLNAMTIILPCKHSRFCEILRIAQDDIGASAPRHHLQKKTLKVFCFRNRRENWMIRCLLKPAQSSRRTPGIRECIHDCFGECGVAHVMRT